MNALKGLMGSKKAMAAIVGVVITGWGTKIGIPADNLNEIVYLIIAYIVGQGAADWGKSAAAAAVAAPPAPVK